MVYKVPPRPTSNRVYVWRKLKKTGALLWHDAVWILPSADRTKEHFQWLAAEIVELGGEAQVWEAHAAWIGQEDFLIRKFREQSDDAYRAILERLQAPDADRVQLANAYVHAKRTDYFQSELGEQVRNLLEQSRDGEDG